MARRMSAAQRAAHTYADAGWPVFPALAGFKTPATSHGFDDASVNHRQIARWWKNNPWRNVAIATGTPGPDVLDIDVHPDGTGYPAFNQLKRAGLVTEPKAVVRTPSGGMHLYYTGTEQRNGHLPGVHLDYRGAGGYVIAPPSIVAGRPYEVVDHHLSSAVFDWPATRNLLQPDRPAPGQRHPTSGVRLVNPDRLVAWVGEQHEGNRNAALFYAANRALDANRPDLLDHLAHAAHTSGLDDREIDRTLRSAQQQPSGHQAQNRKGPTTMPDRPHRPEQTSDDRARTAAAATDPQRRTEPPAAPADADQRVDQARQQGWLNQAINRPEPVAARTGGGRDTGTGREPRRPAQRAARHEPPAPARDLKPPEPDRAPARQQPEPEPDSDGEPRPAAGRRGPRLAM